MILYINDNRHILKPLNTEVKYFEESGEVLINTIDIVDLDDPLLHSYSRASVELLNG